MDGRREYIVRDMRRKHVSCAILAFAACCWSLQVRATPPLREAVNAPVDKRANSPAEKTVNRRVKHVVRQSDGTKQAAKRGDASGGVDSVAAVRNRARAAAATMRKADLLLERGDVLEACGLYAHTLELLPSWWLPHLALVRCGRMLGRPAERLLEHARFAVTARPKIPATHLQLAITLEELGKFEDAIGALEAAVALRPDFFEARYRLGLLEASAGDVVKAIEHLNRTIQDYPGHVVALHTLATLHEKAGHIDAALHTWTQLLAYSRSPRTVMGRIGRLLSANGRTRELTRLKQHWLRLDTGQN